MHYAAYLCALASVASLYCSTDQLNLKYSSPNRIVCTFVPDTLSDIRSAQDRFILSPDELQRLNYRIAKRQLMIPGISGIYVTYNGFATFSDREGRATLPFVGEKQDLLVVVTQKIVPIVIIGNTVDHMLLSESAPSAWYHITKETVNGSQWWDIRMIEPPRSGRIPHNALVIFAKPKQVYFKAARTPAPRSTQMILPELHVSPNISLGINALNFLKYNRFYRPLESAYKRTPQSYAQLFQAPA